MWEGGWGDKRNRILEMGQCRGTGCLIIPAGKDRGGEGGRGWEEHEVGGRMVEGIES